MNRRICSLLCVVSLAVCGAGCGVKMMGPAPGGGSAGSGYHTHVLIENADYYTDNPAQGRAANGQFQQGEKVTLIQRAGSYSLVRSANGVQAYVSTGSIRAAN